MPYPDCSKPANGIQSTRKAVCSLIITASSPRGQIREFLTRKWEKELDYRLTKALRSFTENRIAVRFQYEYHDAHGQWFRAYGNELWEFDDEGLMRRREASINDVPVEAAERKFHWPAPGPRPANDAGIPSIR
jgi:nuclear transport factor 2 (NTF2) superfamily protein